MNFRERRIRIGRRLSATLLATAVAASAVQFGSQSAQAFEDPSDVGQTTGYGQVRCLTKPASRWTCPLMVARGQTGGAVPATSASPDRDENVRFAAGCLVYPSFPKDKAGFYHLHFRNGCDRAVLLTATFKGFRYFTKRRMEPKGTKGDSLDVTLEKSVPNGALLKWSAVFAK